VVRGSGNRRNTVTTRCKAIGDNNTQNTIDRGGVETLKEGEDFGIQGGSRVERRHLLYGDMTVTEDGTVDQLLRSGKVGAGRVRECSGVQIVDPEFDGERSVGRNGVKVLWGLEFDGRHEINGREIANRGGVARSRQDLFTIRNGLAQAGVDKVVRANEGVYLTNSLCLSIDVLDDGGIQCESGGWVAVAVVTDSGRRCHSGKYS